MDACELGCLVLCIKTHPTPGLHRQLTTDHGQLTFNCQRTPCPAIALATAGRAETFGAGGTLAHPISLSRNKYTIYYFNLVSICVVAQPCAPAILTTPKRVAYSSPAVAQPLRIRAVATLGQTSTPSPSLSSEARRVRRAFRPASRSRTQNKISGSLRICANQYFTWMETYYLLSVLVCGKIMQMPLNSMAGSKRAKRPQEV